MRITLVGDELIGLDPGLPAASVRLLLPRSDGVLEVPVWNGNEFLLADGGRPSIRTLTPLQVDTDAGRLVVEVVIHQTGALSAWAASAAAGDTVAVSGTGRGFDVDPEVTSYVLAGDESALPAITTLLQALPHAASVQVLVELGAPDARVDLPHHPRATVEWVDQDDLATPCSALADSVASAEIGDDTVVWAAGEAAGVQRIRKHLFDERGVPRSQAHVRGYWKHGRVGAGS